MAHKHNKGHNQEAMNYNQNKEDKLQTQQNQPTTNDDTTYYNQNDPQCVNLQYARQNNRLYANRYMTQPTSSYRYRIIPKQPQPYVKQNLHQYHQQQNYAHQYFAPAVYNQQHMHQHTNPQYMNPQYMNAQYMNRQHIMQHTNQRNDYHQPLEGRNLSVNQFECQDQHNDLLEKTLTSKPKEPITAACCCKKFKMVKSKSKSEKPKCRLVKIKSRIHKCKPCKCKIKPCKCKTISKCKCKPSLSKCNPCKCKRLICKSIVCKCKPSTSKSNKPSISKCKPCKCHKIRIKIYPPCPPKSENDDQKNEDKETDLCKGLLKGLEEKEGDVCNDINDKAKVKIENFNSKTELNKDIDCKSKDNDNISHTCHCEHHSIDILNIAKDQEFSEKGNKSRYQNDNRKDVILKKNSEFHHKDEDSQLLLTKNNSYPHPNQQTIHTCECHSKDMKTSQKKIMKQENNKNHEQSSNSKRQNDKHVDQYQAIMPKKNILPHYHLDKNRVLLPKNHNKYRNRNRQSLYYELHTHDFSKKRNDLLINQAGMSGKSECQENEKSPLNYRHDDQSQIELTNKTRNQLDQDSQNFFEGNPKEMHVRLNDITMNQDNDQDHFGAKNTKELSFKSKNIVEKMKNRNDQLNNEPSEIYLETGGDTTLKASKLKSSKLQYLQQKRRDVIQDSISFCSIM